VKAREKKVYWDHEEDLKHGGEDDCRCNTIMLVEKKNNNYKLAITTSKEITKLSPA
jgi:hypothetical protein